MISRLRLTTIFIFLVISGPAQDLSRKDADSLLSSLNSRISDKDRINALLELASFNVHERKASDTMLRAAGEYLRQAGQLNKKSAFPFFTEQSLLVRSGLHKAQGDLQEGKDLLSQAIELLKATNNKVLLGRAWYEMSEYYSLDFLHETMVQRIRCLQLAIDAFLPTNQFVELARCYRFLADLHQLLNDNRSAFDEVTKAIKFYDQAGYSEKQGAVALLGRIYYEQGDYKQALHNELMALKIATNSPQDNVRLLCQINNNIGYTYLKLNETQKALQYFLQALQIAEREKDNATIYLLAANVVDAYLKLNSPLQAVHFFQQINWQFARPAELKYEGGDYGISHTYLKIFMALRQYDKARYYCDELIRQASNPHINLYTLSLYNQLIAQYYIETVNYERARYYLKKDKDLVTTLKSFSGLAQNYKLRFSMDTASSQYKVAITDLIMENEMRDSIFDETKSKQIAQLDIEYETEKKETQIKLLNQTAALEAIKLKQTDFLKNVTIGGVILMLIIAGLLFRQSRFRKKSNIIVTQKNELLQILLKEKEWLIKEVHHRVKNNLHTVMSLLESQARYLEDDALRAIETSQHRIHAMSLIHQKLYQSDDNLGDIDTGSYLKELVWYLSESFGSPSNIYLDLMMDSVTLNLSRAIPLGLIVNEAVTNAFKYAFPKNRSGKITLEMRQAAGNIKLVIADNGVGMHSSQLSGSSWSLGLSLMHALAGELDGDIRFENDGGTSITLFFPIAPVG